MTLEEMKNTIIAELKEIEVESSRDVSSMDEYNKRMNGLNKLLCMVDEAIEQYPDDQIFLFMKNRINHSIHIMELAKSIGVVREP